MQNNLTIKTNYSKNKEISESILIDAFMIDILKYLTLEDIGRTRAVSKFFYRLIDQESNIIFEKLNVSAFDDKINIDWILKIVKQNQIKSLNLLLCENYYYVRQILFSTNPEYLEELKIPTKFFMSDGDLVTYSRLKKLTIKNMYFNEGGLSEDIFMIQNLIQMPWVESVKLNNIKYVKGTFIQYLTNSFVKIDFRESPEFKIEDMRDFLIKQISTLQILRLDGEFSNEVILKDCLLKLNNLTELYIGYCENFNDYFLNELSNITNQFTRLTLRKLRVSSAVLEHFFNKINMSEILKLDFYDCPSLNNNCVNIIAASARNLNFLEISWSTGVKNDSVINLFKNCKELKFLYVQGCKHLDDKIFQEFLEPDMTSLNKKNHKYNAFNSLQLLDFSKCDLVSDSIIYKVMNIYLGLAIINYYGMNLKNKI